MKTLIVAEHDNQSLKAATLNAVAAAQQLGGDIDVLVVGSGCQAAADAAASVQEWPRCFLQTTPLMKTSLRRT
jgi:electron transfer flavoprotein alpha subunit